MELCSVRAAKCVSKTSNDFRKMLAMCWSEGKEVQLPEQAGLQEIRTDTRKVKSEQTVRRDERTLKKKKISLKSASIKSDQSDKNISFPN